MTFVLPGSGQWWVWRVSVRRRRLTATSSMAYEETWPFAMSEFDGTATSSCLSEPCEAEFLGSAQGTPECTPQDGV